MTGVDERALAIACGTERLIGILAEAKPTRDIGVVIVVGGPQYRVGSHRQFVLLARALAASGAPTLRFDVRGMGDSTGSMQSFEESALDIGCAIDAMIAECPRVRRVVLWGLCDAASAILLYSASSPDARLAGMVLVNPWVRSDVTYAKTQLVHYYGRRILQTEFWKKLLRRDVDVLDGAVSVVRGAAIAGGLVRRAERTRFQERMADGLRGFTGPVLLMLSGQDLTAREFVDYAAADPRWRGLLSRRGLTRCDFPGADHTFSDARAGADARKCTVDWLEQQVGKVTE